MSCPARPSCLRPFKRGDLSDDSLRWSINSALIDRHEECHNTAEWLLSLSVGCRALVWAVCHYGFRLLGALSMAREMRSKS